jgi:DNA-binding NtrC family response regulator
MSESMFPANPILIVDDEPITLESVEMVLNSEGINNIILCQDSREVKRILKENEISIILSDLMMPFVSGEEILQYVADNFPEIPVIIITGVNDVETTVRCMKSSAYDYIVKPADENRLITTVNRGIHYRELQNEAATLRRHLLSESLINREPFNKIITQNKKMISIFQYIESVAKSTQPVLITGETGVGKELFAEAIHKSSGREGNFVALNIAGLDENIFADTLFGHLKGAYTGAERARDGLVEMASGGTLFLDEIGDLKQEHQIKLLRLIEAREYFQLGADAPRKSNVRIVVATNRNLKEMSMNKDGFRNDLYFRLSAHQISIPPLRERKDDLPLLIDSFLEEAASEMGKKKPTPPPELVSYLSTYNFPGNIRELKALVYDAVANHKTKMLNLGVFKKYIDENSAPSEGMEVVRAERIKQYEVHSWENLPTIKEITNVLIEEALKRTNGNQSIAARLLGITRQTLINYIKIKNK